MYNNDVMLLSLLRTVNTYGLVGSRQLAFRILGRQHNGLCGVHTSSRSVSARSYQLLTTVSMSHTATQQNKKVKGAYPQLEGGFQKFTLCLCLSFQSNTLITPILINNTTPLLPFIERAHTLN
jgi:hypothetical protein